MTNDINITQEEPSMYDLLEAVEEWAEDQAKLYRAEGWASHQRKENIREATYIGREYAFMVMVYKIREIRDNLERGIPNV